MGWVGLKIMLQLELLKVVLVCYKYYFRFYFQPISLRALNKCPSPSQHIFSPTTTTAYLIIRIRLG
jgi:hypothetical protein